MLKRIFNKCKWILFEQPSFSRISVNRFVSAELARLSDGITLEICAGRSQTLRKLLKNDTQYISLNLLLGNEPDVVADAVKMPFADSSIQNIILVEVLEHITNPDCLLKECHRVLKPGGCLVGSTRFTFFEHAAPYDYHRFTAGAIKHHCRMYHNVKVTKSGNKFQVVMDLLSEKRPLLRCTNRLLAKMSRRTNDTCYSGVFFIAEQ